MLGLSFKTSIVNQNYQSGSLNPFVKKHAPVFSGKKTLENDTFQLDSSKIGTGLAKVNDTTSSVNTLINSIRAVSGQVLSSTTNPIDIINQSVSMIKGTSIEDIQGNSNKELIKELLKEVVSEDLDTQKTAIALLGKLRNKVCVKMLIDLINKNSTNPDVAIEAIYALGHIDDTKSIQSIIDVLTDTDKDETLRAVSAMTLGKMKNRRASKVLFEVLRDKDDSSLVRSCSALALSEFPTIRNTEQLIRALHDPSEKVRSKAVLALGIIGNKDSISKILPLLNDSNSDVKSNAALTLGNLKAEEAISELIRALDETNSEVIVSISRALKYIGSEKVVPKIITTLKNSSNEIILRRNAAASLQIINDKSAVPALNEIMADENEDLLLRNYALSALMKLKSPESIKNLSNILNNQNENFQLRINSAAAIGILGNESNLNELAVTALDTEIADLKNNCLNAIRNIASKCGDKTNFDSAKLLPLLDENNPKLVALTADAFGILKTKQAASKLESLAVDEEQEPIVRAYAVEALGKIGDKKVKNTLLNLLKKEKLHAISAKSAAALYNLGYKEDLFNIVKDSNENFRVKNHAAGTLIANGEKNKELKVFLRPGLQVTKLHDIGIKGQGIEVAVIDDKVNPNHREFDNRIVVEPLEHGTMVAGNLGGNLSGVAPKVTIHTYDAFGNKKNLVNALERIIDQKIKGDNDIKVVNISLGYNPKLMTNPAIQSEIKQFDQLAKIANKLGITIVVAAGNDGRDIPLPTLGTLNLLCLSNNVISVGASTINGTPDKHTDDDRAEFSSYPAKDCPRQLDVMAPGFEVTLPDKGGSYKIVDGTSFSAPFISGLVSLMYQVNPNIKPDEVKSIIKDTAVKLKNVPDYMQGSGEVDPLSVVVRALEISNPDEAKQLASKLGVNFPEQFKIGLDKFNKIA